MSNITTGTGSREDVFVVRTSKPVVHLWKSWLFWSRYSLKSGEKDKKHFCNAIESRKQYIKNLSNEQLTDEQITLLSRGLKFIPAPVTKENPINQFARRMRLQNIFHGKENEPHPFHVKSDQSSRFVALETFLEEVKLELASIELDKPKDNLREMICAHWVKAQTWW